jgi:DNA-binding MarR family transcriptional regulator
MPQFRAKLSNIGGRSGEAAEERPDESLASGDSDAGRWPLERVVEEEKAVATSSSAPSPPPAAAVTADSPSTASTPGSGRHVGRGGTATSRVQARTPAAAPLAPGLRQTGPTRLRMLRDAPRPFLHMPSLQVPSRAAVESAARELLSAPVEAARQRLQNPRELSDRIAMGRAIWRDLVIGFAAQLGELNLSFTQLAALYALADCGTMTVADLADTLGRSPSAMSRLADSLVQRQLIERTQDAEDRRQRTLALTGRGKALLGLVDRARAQEFLAIVRPLPTAERAVVAMGVAALSTHAISRRGRLIKQRPR